MTGCTVRTTRVATLVKRYSRVRMKLISRKRSSILRLLVATDRRDESAVQSSRTAEYRDRSRIQSKAFCGYWATKAGREGRATLRKFITGASKVVVGVSAARSKWVSEAHEVVSTTR